jgi:ABC-type glycerol-3-phosphate transport system permease component
MVKPAKIRPRGGDLLFDIVNHTILVLAAIVVIYPLYFIVIASFSDPQKVMLGEVLLYPKDVSAIGYERLLHNRQIWRSYLNTIVYTLAGTSLNIFVTMTAGYALSRKFAGRKTLSFFLIFTMFFSGGLIPTFLAVRNYGLYNNPLIMIVMGAISIWNLMIARTFISSSLPAELYEAAEIDGCSHFRYFWSFVLPLSQALIGVLCVYYAVGHWNDFMTGLIYLRNHDYMPLQVVLKNLVASLAFDDTQTALVADLMDNAERARVAEVVKYCAIIISTVPIIALYMVLQKYFVQGVMIGSIKG